MALHVMLVPSLACPANCRYCFGPREGSEQMALDTIRAVASWQRRLHDHRSLEITFHGGEPLLPGADFYRQALPVLREGLAGYQVRFAIQSNLWLLTDELCELFRSFGVSIGTSLDGPEALNDAQRGDGYFRRTMAGIERARRHGLNVGCICTFTRQSLPHAGQIFDFFLDEGLSFSIHAGVRSLRHPDSDRWGLSALEHGSLLVEMLDRYRANLTRVRISTLDSLCRSVSAGQGGICTFGDCLGGYLAVGPDGSIYPCQRFAGMVSFRIGNVHDCPSWADLQRAPAWLALAKRQEQVARECAGCAHLAICKGGCPYDALAAGGGRFDGSLKDPHCESYRQIFSYISEQALQEVFSEENMAAVVQRPDPERGLLRKGRLLSLMGGGQHPYETARHSRRLLAAAALAVYPPEEVARRLHSARVLPNPGRSLPALRAMNARLNSPVSGRNNLYLHVTFACNLRCSHCYASTGERGLDHTPPGLIARAAREGAAAGFRHVVITGGEPLCHPQRAALLDTLAELRREGQSNLGRTLTVLRTNLCVPLDPETARRVAFSTDQVVVSLDGDAETHDARRGEGSYETTVRNLRVLMELRSDPGETFTDLSLATVLPFEQARGAPGESVRALARELGIRRTRFRPLLPLGRALENRMEITPETQWAQSCAQDTIARGFSPTASCGLGQNLYVEPDGASYPCYAWTGPSWSLGNIYSEGGLAGVLEGEGFRELVGHTVNTNRRCRSCALRYLCGGACRAWSQLPAEQQVDLDAAPRDCTALHSRARALLAGALRSLEIEERVWTDSGLPLPAGPPKAAT